MNLLIPYVKLPDHHDPMLQEFTYGDVDQRGRKLRALQEGDCIFFHTTIQGGGKCITAYYTVARVMDTKDVVKAPELVSKYHNPHIGDLLAGEDRGRDNVMVFGDPITSRMLTTPLPFNRNWRDAFRWTSRSQQERTESQAIGSATRAWRELTENDVRILEKAIRVSEASTEEAVTSRKAVDDSAVEVFEKSYAKSQGFVLDSKLRKALETHAMTTAQRYFEAEGYTCEDHSKVCPYDLCCRREKETLYIEVKGTQTDGNEIILTRGEVAFARKHKGQMALFILHTIPVSEEKGQHVLGVGKRKLIQPWDVDLGTLKPLTFKYEP